MLVLLHKMDMKKQVSEMVSNVPRLEMIRLLLMTYLDPVFNPGPIY